MRGPGGCGLLEESFDEALGTVHPWAAATLHQLAVRARDASGEVQTEERVDAVPHGATGQHSISVTVE